MRRAAALRLALTAAVLCLTGCSSSNKGKIEGTKWSSLESTIKGQKIPAGTLRLDFGANNSLVYDTAMGKFTGTYSLGMGDRVTLKLDRELAGFKNHVERVSIVGDRLTMTDGTSMVFERK
jgi:hypothetical protein